jgi:penicillin-binding protein 1C
MLLVGLLAGCGGNSPRGQVTSEDLIAQANGEMAGLVADLSSVDIMDIANVVGVETVVDAADVMDLVSQYLADYRARYELRPRPEGDPQAVAEAYMRRYQPGVLPRIFETTRIYDRQGVQLAELVDEGYRTWVPLEQISPYLIRAVLATEDASFYTNPGYDARRVIGALMQNAEAGEIISGASTITMQLARQLFFTPEERFEQSLERKAFETLLAQDLTLLFAKDDLLEMYLNLVHFGRTVYGVEAAANLYFGKSAADLTLVEATLLAGIPQQPADYDLYNNFEAVKQRQAVVLSLMVRHGDMNEIESRFVYATEVELQPLPDAKPVLAPHFVQYVTTELARRLPGVDVRRTGMDILTTLDYEMQQMAQRIVAEQVTQLRPTYDLSNAALVALKPGTAEILTMVGSADFDNVAISGQVNVAVRQRQPGSAIKPVLYALALNDLQISPATVIWDVKAEYKISDVQTYTPRNYDGDFHGPVTVRTALANSYNIPAVKLLDAVGVPRMLEGGRAMGLQSLSRDTSWYGLSLVLGGGEVTLLDLTSAYHTLANEGRYLAPQSILATAGAPDGRELTLLTAENGVQVISPEAAYQVTDILSDNGARTIEFGANSALQLSRPAVAKTGTTNDYRDNWTEGYTRYLVAGVWAGNSDGRPMRNVSGVTGAAPIWNAFMEAVIADPELAARLGAPDPAREVAAEWAFTPPDGLVKAPVACPGGMVCPEDELFDARWLAQFGGDGPLADSIVVANVNTVYVDRGRGSRPVGACSAESGATRQLLRLPVGLTRALLTDGEKLALSTDPNLVLTAASAQGAEEEALDPDLAARIRQEQVAALQWSANAGTPLYFGPCAQIEETVRRVFGNSVVAVRVSDYVERAVENVDDVEEEQTATQQVVATQAPTEQAKPSSYYGAAGVAHDRSCNGDFVMGSVYNARGQLVQGVAVIFRDEMGNNNFAAVVNGSYRFSVVEVERSHNIFLYLVDATGTAMSPTITVPHRQGGASDLGCHYVIWQGVD